MHAAPSAPVYPAMQVHSLTDALALGESLLAGQGMQLEFRYVPAAQALHVSPSRTYPALHVQSVIAPLSAAELEAAGHDVHAVAIVIDSPPAENAFAGHTSQAPSLLLKPALHVQAANAVDAVGLVLVAGHGTQLELPLWGLYVPVPHCTHCVPSGV